MISRVLISHCRGAVGSSILKSSGPVFRFSQKDQKFFRFIDFDAKYLSEVPWIFKPIQPIIHSIRDWIFQSNQFIGLPWWAIIVLTSILSRIVIFPLIFVQMKKMSRIGPVFPIFVHMKESWRSSNLSSWKKIRLGWKMYKKLAKQENFRLRSVFVYNLAYYPVLISMIFSLRSLLSIESVANSGFLYLNNLGEIDPFYILPTLTIACYYWNFERFITPQNKNTLISRIRALCQVFLILWYPFLCCWPSGIVLYMFTNSLISVLQSTLIKSMWFQSKLNPKVIHYHILLATNEYDKKVSDSIILAIKTGQQSIKQKTIKQEVLVDQTQKMLKKLNKQLQDEKKGKFKEQDEASRKQEQAKKPNPFIFVSEQQKNAPKKEEFKQISEKWKKNKKKEQQMSSK